MASYLYDKIETNVYFMKRTYLGEFEEVVLLMVAILDGQAYGVTVCGELEAQTGRQVTFGTVHNTLIRLEEKGFVSSYLGGATAERGGRRKRLFTLTPAGSRALQDIQQLRSQLWELVPPHTIKLAGI
jgi:DNA-binding PadR family transcriptional regulator